MLSRFLPSVLAATPSSLLDGRWEAEVIVADNGSTDDSRELLDRNFPNVARVDLGRNWGFAEGYNRALRGMRADVFVLLNSDAQTPDGWLEPLLTTFESYPDVAAVVPKLLAVNDKDVFEYAGASGGFIDWLGYPFCRGRIVGALERDRGQYNDARRIFWGTGACLALRADVFREVGELDGDFFAHQEEIDLCWRMQLAGWGVMVEPQSVVYHLGGGTLTPSPQKLYLNYRNNLAMLYKNLPWGRMWLVVVVRLVLNTLSSIVYMAGGQWNNGRTVWRAHRDFFRMVRGRWELGAGGVTGEESGRMRLREKRRRVQSGRVARPVGVYRGSILLRYLLGRRTFSGLRI